MSWISLKDVAHQSLSKKGISNQIQESLVLSKANQLLVDFFGSEAQDKARAIYWQAGVLTIAVLSDSLFNEMESQQEQLINILNHKLEDQLIENLRFLN